jgi:hypothetical protein
MDEEKVLADEKIRGWRERRRNKVFPGSTPPSP